MLRVILSIFIAAAIFAVNAFGQANLTFSGGNGSPLSITLQQSVVYTINTSSCSASGSPVFIFDEAGNPFLSTGRAVSGTITFSINGGTAQPVNTTGSGFTENNLSVNDIYVLGVRPGAPNGSTVVLSAGTITTNSNVAAPPPANGSYTTFITNASSAQCSNNGVAAPPTAASVSISGRVLTNSRRGLANAFVYLTDQNGNTRVSRTNSFGYYRFEDVQAGQTVIVTVVSKRFQFAPQVLNLTEEVTQVNFVAENPARL